MLDQSNPRPDLDVAVEFLRALRPGGPWNLTAIVPDGPIYSATFTDPRKTRNWLARYVDHANLHFTAIPRMCHVRCWVQNRQKPRNRVVFRSFRRHRHVA